MQVVDAKFVAHWKQQYWAPSSWGSMEFSAFLVFAVWTSSMTYLTFGKGELQNMHHFLSLYSYFSPCYLIFRGIHLGKWKFSTPLQILRAVKHKGMHKTALFKGRSTLVAMVTTAAYSRPRASFSYKNVKKKEWNVYFSISS